MARIAQVGYRLDLAALPLCASSAAGTGITVDYIGAYAKADRPTIAAMLGLHEAPQVASVVAGSAAARAGVRPGDDILAIDGTSTTGLLDSLADPGLLADEIETRLAATPAATPVTLTLQRNETPLKVTFVPERVCSARFVVKTGKGLTAFGDGKNVAIAAKMIAFTRNDDELAVIAGHELAHIVNRDGKASGISGRRHMEDRADLLGAGLARCAGYDLPKGLAVWDRYNKQDVLRFLRDPTHRSVPARLELIRSQAMTGNCPPDVGLAQDAGGEG